MGVFSARSKLQLVDGTSDVTFEHNTADHTGEKEEQLSGRGGDAGGRRTAARSNRSEHGQKQDGDDVLHDEHTEDQLREPAVDVLLGECFDDDHLLARGRVGDMARPDSNRVGRKAAGRAWCVNIVGDTIRLDFDHGIQPGLQPAEGDRSASICCAR